MKIDWIIIAAIFAMLPGCLTVDQKQEEPPAPTRGAASIAGQVKLTEIMKGTMARPLHLTHAGDGSNRLFVVGQGGIIRIIQNGEGLAQPFLDVSSLITRDYMRGLLGLAFHPDYQINGWFYISYINTTGNLVAARYQVSPSNPNLADASSGQIIIRISPSGIEHSGGHLAFGPDGYLYIALGDGASGGSIGYDGQDTLSLPGSILRIDVDKGLPYAIPADNPFAGDEAGLDEIWAYGLRHPWHFSFDRQTGDLYIGDVGQYRWEEVNFQPADSQGGENYGWPIWEASHPYADTPPPAANHVPPFFEYHHSKGCAVIGGYVYRGSAIPDLEGFYLFGDHCSGTIWAARRDAEMQWHISPFLHTSFSISGFGEDEQGELYVIDRKNRLDGIARLYRLDPNS